MDARILWKIRGYVVLASLATLLIFGLLGAGMDAWLGSSPKALIVALIVSFPVTNLFAIRLAKARLLPS